MELQARTGLLPQSFTSSLSRWLPYVAAVLAAVAVLAATWLIDRSEQERFSGARHAAVLSQASAMRAQIEEALNARLYLVNGLAAYAVANPDLDQAQFETFASGLLGNRTGIRELALTRGTTIAYVYPRSTNEAALGVDLLQVPAQRQAVQDAIDRRAFVVAGPLELVQGGTAFVGRVPIFVQQGDIEEFWGLALIVIEQEPFFAEAGLLDSSPDLQWALRGRDGRGAAGDVFLGEASLFEGEAEVLNVSLPSGSWQLAAAPAGGWAPTSPAAWTIRIGGGLIALLGGMLAFLVVRWPTRLRAAVDQATGALREREEQYRSIFESTTDGLIITDMETGTVVAANPACCRMHGYEVDEFVGLHGTTFIHADHHVLFEDYLRTVRAGREFRTRARDVRKDGGVFHVEVYGKAFSYRGRPHILAVVRDVTEQVDAQQVLERRVAERTRELKALLDISQNVASTLELTPLLELVLAQLRGLVDYTSTAILALDGDELVVTGQYGPLAEADVLPLRWRIADLGPIWDTLLRGEPVIVPDLGHESPAAASFRRLAGPWLDDVLPMVRSCLCVPLMVKDRVIGLLSITSSQPGYYTERDGQLALAVARQAAIAIENARLYETAQGKAALEERQRLARELHDSVSQALYGIALGARTARTLLDREPPRAAQPLDYVLSLAEAGLAEMRALIFELRPESLESEGLVAALTKQAEALRARHGLAAELDLCDEPDLPLEAKEALYRVSQEALQNAVKHARAGSVRIRLASSSTGVLLEIRDDGVGFDPNQGFPGHLGLRSMRERVQRLGGTFELNSSPGSGTHLSARLPSQP